ncbi:hypothetical protein ACFVVA_36810 [Kitasatospora sp. NPDC058048]|uniref:hypothetical protein n=1 Tax=Kitasatospora sp. NPDC058048 TaxID=3346313 RepID=UPI0036D90A28
MTPSGRRCVLLAEPTPAGKVGRRLIAVGQLSSPERLPIPAPRQPAEDLVMLAVALGVLG